uniref:Uncharacterized protein n=1 Tax=Arundo donax TaxID=35708 RepID=A0A0A9F0P8_ARUDO
MILHTDTQLGKIRTLVCKKRQSKAIYVNSIHLMLTSQS